MTTATKQIHAARWIDKGTAFWFASLDGELWLGVTDDPRLATVGEIENIFAGTATRPRTLPMRIARRFLAGLGATFMTGEQHE